MSLFSRGRTKRNAVTAIVIALPLLLFAVIRERQTWLPRTLRVAKSDGVSGVAWTPDSKSLVVGTAKALQIWDTQKMVLRRSIKSQEPMYDIRFTPSGLLSSWVSGGPDAICTGSVDLWNLKNGKRVLAPKVLYPVAFSPDGRRIIDNRIGWNSSSLPPCVDIRSFDIHSGRLIKKVSVKIPKGTDYYRASMSGGGTCGGPPIIPALLSGDGKWGALKLYSPAKKWVYSGGFIPSVDNSLIFFDAQTGKHLARVSAAFLPVQFEPSTFSEDGRTLVLSGVGVCQLRDAQTGRLLKSIRDSRVFRGWMLVERSDEVSWLIGVEQQDSIVIWNSATGRILREINVTGSIVNIALSPDGRTLAVNIGSAVQLYRMR